MRIRHILGIPVHDITYAETLDWFTEAISADAARQVCTVNPEFVIRAQNDEDFRCVLSEADLCLPDGQGLLWAARARRKPLRERVAGSTLTWRIAARAAEFGWRLYFLGAAQGVAVGAAEILAARYPGLNVVGTYSGSAQPEEAAHIIARVREARPDVLFVAYGAPQQDFWIARYRDELDVPVMMGVGGSLDFVTGTAVRAPEWLQRLGLEWLHRLLIEPWRWRRMLALPKFVWAVLTRRDAVV